MFGFLIDVKRIKNKAASTFTTQDNTDLISDTAAYIFVVFAFCVWLVYTGIQDYNEFHQNRGGSIDSNFDRTVFVM